MNKYILSFFLRKLSLIKLSDKLRFYFLYVKTCKSRKQFHIDNPEVKLPPSYYIYETFNLNYVGFYNSSIETAKWLISYFEKFKRLENVNILDWGCGPGRIITHMPGLVSHSCTMYGTDYNREYIQWCTKYLHQITFTTNKIAPPLSFENDCFDIIYGISVFTHLSKELHFAWFHELIRVAKPDGILFLTSHGDAFRNKLTGKEKVQYDNGIPIVKGNTKEGHRTYSAFQPASFVNELIGKNQVLEHVPGVITNGNPQQDIWIIKVIK